MTTAGSIGDGGAALLGYRARTCAARALRRERANARVSTTLKTEAIADPLDHRTATSWERLGRQVALVAVSGAVHGAVVLVGLAFPSVPSVERNAYAQPVHVEVIEAPKPAETVEPKAPVPPPDPPKVEPQSPIVKTEPRTVTPPPDPVNLAPPADVPPEPTSAPPRRVVGLNMESTTTAGAGPAFAPGNTRMGETAGVAEAVPKSGGLSPEFIPPRRTNARTPVYPASLKSGGVEGDVLLSVSIDAAGRVLSATVTRSSGKAELDASAIASARESTYEPARRSGVAVAYAIEFTVRFRLH